MCFFCHFDLPQEGHDIDHALPEAIDDMACQMLIIAASTYLDDAGQKTYANSYKGCVFPANRGERTDGPYRQSSKEGADSVPGIEEADAPRFDIWCIVSLILEVNGYLEVEVDTEEQYG